MIAFQVSAPQVKTTSVEAIWALIQCQTKSVQQELTKRFVALDLQSRLSASREDIRKGRGITLHSKEEMQSYLASL